MKEMSYKIKSKRLLYKIFPNFISRLKLRMNRKRKLGLNRCLEIGPGNEIIQGFERYNIIQDGFSDYVGKATNLSIFKDKEFDLVYASHVLEHIPWYWTLKTLREWQRIIKNGGSLEVWVPDGLKIAHAYVKASLDGNLEFRNDGWYRFNEEKSYDLWFSGRMFSYGDDQGSVSSNNWHRAIFSESFLRSLLIQAGFNEINRLKNAATRGHDHGWINLGFKAIK